MAKKQPIHIQLRAVYQSKIFHKKKTQKKQKASLIPVARSLCVASVISLLLFTSSSYDVFPSVFMASVK